MRHRLRHVTAARWAVALISVSLVLGYAPAVAAPATASVASVEQAVRDQVANGDATFWVLLKEQADLSAVKKTTSRAARGQKVYDLLTTTANRSQAGLRAALQARAASFQSYWIVNTMRVTGGAALLNEIAARPEVAEIRADVVYQIPEPQPGEEQARIQAIEWGIQRIRADMVWSGFNVRGEGIVVGNIDTGVQYTHPALVNQYRGNNLDGTFDHNYNWHDPSKICGNPSLAPCDNNGHGTHTMGTMVGDDGAPGPNQIGVAPAATWIAAKGCETGSCSSAALLSSGQFMIAPTDLNGMNPDPLMAPNIVNNSWGGGGANPFYRPTVIAWNAAGIFPAFANGNSGPACGSVTFPGSYPESYGVGAFDINNNIAGFSGRGPAPLAFGGGIKPNVSAPGVNVRSSWNNGGYVSISGTSMATPHLAGAVALIWSAQPLLQGDVDGTRTIIDSTAIATSDLTCGGTATDNNVWGRGKLDAFAAVTAALAPPVAARR
jgi:subtilisin family serine protease